MPCIYVNLINVFKPRGIQFLVYSKPILKKI